QAAWRGNFRELGSSIARMATLAEQGRITVALVEEEITRLRANWQSDAPTTALSELPPELANIDLFEQRQLETVLDVCRTANSLSEAGRQLFAVSRQQKQKPNDADRLRKYLARFGLSWEELKRV
ncbi:sigma 54-dependent transcriptional regulator, partial [Pectobacterium brasiliense]|nr:sigma 54-dependent transcriptional regulator [Pectobacterium brasiliense]